MSQAAAVAAVNRKKEHRKKLKRMASNRLMVKEKLDDFFEKYDNVGSSDGSWDDEELKQALQAARPSDSHAVDQEAIDFVKSVADVSKNGKIDKDEVMSAVQAYTTYMDRKEEIDRVLARYDKDNDGTLDKTEVQSLLVGLTSEDEVTEEDVELVFKMCDDSRNAKIDPNEIKKAIAFWYGQLAEREEKKNAKGGGGSKMCLIL